MIITDKNIEYIETSLSFYGIKDALLKEDLLDHICTHIENSNEENFELSYKEAIEKLGGYASMQNIQKDINEKSLIKSFLARKRAFYLVSTFNIMLLTIGMLFKLNKWPYSSIMLATGFGMLIFITIPFAFYNKYKHSNQKTILQNK
jgi:positive regulator of sigma E activity